MECIDILFQLLFWVCKSTGEDAVAGSGSIAVMLLLKELHNGVVPKLYFGAQLKLNGRAGNKSLTVLLRLKTV